MKREIVTKEMIDAGANVALHHGCDSATAIPAATAIIEAAIAALAAAPAAPATPESADAPYWVGYRAGMAMVLTNYANKPAPDMDHFCRGENGSGAWCYRSEAPSVCGYCGEPNAAQILESGRAAIDEEIRRIRSAATPESAEPVAWPKVRGCGRDGSDGTGRTLNLFLAERPSDNSLRAIHDALLRSPTPAASDGGLREAIIAEVKDWRKNVAAVLKGTSADDPCAVPLRDMARRQSDCADAIDALLADYLAPPTEQAKPSDRDPGDVQACTHPDCGRFQDGAGWDCRAEACARHDTGRPVAAPAQGSPQAAHLEPKVLVTDSEADAMLDARVRGWLASAFLQDEVKHHEAVAVAKAMGNALLALRGAPPAGVVIPRSLANRVQESLGKFTCDEGWGTSDMETFDDFYALTGGQK